MMMVQYLIDVDEEVRIPDIARSRPGSRIPSRRFGWRSSRSSAGQEINDLFKLARDAGDYKAEQFMQWFVKSRSRRSR